MRSSLLFQFTKYEQLGALALRFILPEAVPSLAGKGVLGICVKPTGIGRSSDFLGITSFRHCATASLNFFATSGSLTAMFLVCPGSFFISNNAPLSSSRCCSVRTLVLPPQLEKIMRSGHCGSASKNNFERSLPSRGLSPTLLIPLSERSVGRISIAPQICATVFPAGNLPGQEIKPGERTPPSSVLPLRPFIPPLNRKLFGPLSEK